jgi:hypothetical protein
MAPTQHQAKTVPLALMANQEPTELKVKQVRMVLMEQLVQLVPPERLEVLVQPVLQDHARIFWIYP